ncbi:MAG: HD domain-containing protein, partial [Fusobacteriaceae bacterium]
MKIEKIIVQIMGEVKDRLEKDSSGHDWYHTLRVYKNSLKIAEYEIEKGRGKNIDIVLLKISALLHDVADHKFGYTDRDRDEIIERILKKHGFSEGFI